MSECIDVFAPAERNRKCIGKSNGGIAPRQLRNNTNNADQRKRLSVSLSSSPGRSRIHACIL